MLDGIFNGFELLPADSALVPAEMENYRSAINPEARSKVEQTLREELQEGNYVISPTKPTIISALGAVPKANSDDCSMPVGQVVNSYVPTLEKLHFQSIDDALKLVDSNFFLTKIDLRHAYRSVPVHPANCPALGLLTFSRG